MDTDILYAKYKDQEYLEFARKLSLTDTLPRAGIRIPDLRAIARKAKPEDIDIKYHEDVILKGLAIANEKIPFEIKALKLNALLPYLSSWDQTDTIQSAFKIKSNEKDLMTCYFESLLTHKDVFPRRLAIIWLMSNRKHLDWNKTLDLIISADSEDEYYIMMAVAWALSFFYFDNLSILSRFNAVSQTTKKKAIQKIKESRRYKKESLEIKPIM